MSSAGCISAFVIATHCTLDSALCCRQCLTERQKSIWKNQCFLSSASLISAPRGKQSLATDVHGCRSKGGGGFWSLADCQGRARQKSYCGIFKSNRDWGGAAASGRRLTQSPTLWREPSQRFRGAIWMAWLFQDMKGNTRSCRPPKCFKGIAAASPRVKTANTVLLPLLVLRISKYLSLLWVALILQIPHWNCLLGDWE